MEVKSNIDYLFSQFNEKYPVPLILHEIKELYESDNIKYKVTFLIFNKYLKF